NKATRKIFKLSQSGTITDFVGSSSAPAGTDGTGGAAGFNNDIHQLVFDRSSQTLYALEHAAGSGSGVMRRIGANGAVGTLTLSSFATHAPADSALPARFG